MCEYIAQILVSGRRMLIICYECGDQIATDNAVMIGGTSFCGDCGKISRQKRQKLTQWNVRLLWVYAAICLVPIVLLILAALVSASART